jgi:hypothetical protein
MSAEHSPITYLSAPAPVSMGDWRFDIATVDHCWVRGRFEVMRRPADSVLRNSSCAAEIGCGNGMAVLKNQSQERTSSQTL